MSRKILIVHGYHYIRNRMPDDYTAGEMIDKFVEVVVRQFYVATVNSVVVGTGFIDLGDGRVGAAFVRHDIMGNGIGKRIMAFCEDLVLRA